ncbi:peptidoglycan-recognition protein SC2-like [Hetaerina americana]|uniref:peptidoglycan-recognition protein SC2-like n=1 Tax=Hetaerina americana TaxID=62018 RepID=UPI003A7F252B
MSTHAVLAVRRPPLDEALSSGTGLPNSSAVHVGDISVDGSTDVVFDNVTEFHGPVTVQQVRAGGALPAKSDAGEGGAGGEESPVCGVGGPCTIRWALGTLALALGVIVLVVVLATLLSSDGTAVVDGGDASSNAAEGGASHGDELLVSRQQWGGKPPKAPADPLTLPVPYVIVSHTATEHCYTFEDCAAVVRSVQGFHMGSRDWWDVGYNFMVGGDGRVYEGRGWDGVGAHARSYNNISIGLSFVGTFSDVEPPARQVTAAKRLIAEGVRLGKVSPDYVLLGHRQVSPTESPGEKLYRMLKTWPHWRELES